nr:MAG TPA: hypothetical protein [Bacteriophage sp.]
MIAHKITKSYNLNSTLLPVRYFQNRKSICPERARYVFHLFLSHNLQLCYRMSYLI